MPQSLAIGAFVFGAVLMLLSLVVGEIEIFGAKVKGTVGKAGRVIAFLFGVFLIGTSLNLNNDHSNASNGAASGTPQPAPASNGAGNADSGAKTQNTSTNQQIPQRPPTQEPATQESLTRKFEEYMPGVWQARSVDPNSGTVMMSEMRFWNNGNFSGTLSGLVGGYPQSQPFSGTWSVRPISADRFVVTVNYLGGGGETHPFRIIDQNSAENQDTGAIAHRVSE